MRLPLLGCLHISSSFFSHRTHRSNRTFLRTVSNPQKAFGIQSSQSVTAIVDINKVQHEAYILLIGVSRWSLPFPSGEGSGEGPLSSMSPVYSVLLCYSVRKRNVLREKKKCPPWEKDLSSVRKRIILCEGRDAIQKDRDYQDISSATPLSFRGHVPLHWRRRLSAIEKKPFKGQEHALLGARKACSREQSITTWFLVGYELYQRRLPPLILRIVCSVICKGFLRSELGYMEGDGELFLTQSTHRPLPQPLPRREGRDMWGYPYWAANTVLGYFFLSQNTQTQQNFSTNVSNSQNASGIQSSQNVIAKGECRVMSVRCWWLANAGRKVLWNRLT